MNSPQWPDIMSVLFERADYHALDNGVYENICTSPHDVKWGGGDRWESCTFADDSAIVFVNDDRGERILVFNSPRKNNYKMTHFTIWKGV